MIQKTNVATNIKNFGLKQLGVRDASSSINKAS
jgi:hypothetical protein